MIKYKSIDKKDLVDAIDNKEFALAYQPIMNFESNEFETFEAFIRWNNPELGTLPPSMFMADISTYDLQDNMTSYIVSEAVDQIRRNNRFGYSETGININLSYSELMNQRTLDIIARSIAKIENPEFLGLEISPQIITSYKKKYPDDIQYHPDGSPSEQEIAYLEKHAEFIKEYDNLGVTLALDTTDYVLGSLIRADYLGLHAVKINVKALQKAIFKDETLIKDYLNVSQDLGVSIIVVGVENQGLFNLVMNNKFQYAQGLFLCPPLCMESPLKFEQYIYDFKKSKQNSEALNFASSNMHKLLSDLQTEQDFFSLERSTPQENQNLSNDFKKSIRGIIQDDEVKVFLNKDPLDKSEYNLNINSLKEEPVTNLEINNIIFDSPLEDTNMVKPELRVNSAKPVFGFQGQNSFVRRQAFGKIIK